MLEAPKPDDEENRLRKLYELDILDTLEEQAYDDLTRIAADLCQTPIALVSLVDKDRQWFKSHHGLDARETPREMAFCAHAILDDDIFVIEDAGKDERFRDNPLYTDAPHVTFYAGAPLIMSDNQKLGTLCVISNEARTISDSQKESLKALARQVVSQLELRLRLKELKILDNIKDEFISMVSHELRTPLTAIYGSLSLIANKITGNIDDKSARLIDISYRNTKHLLSLVNDILDISKFESGTFELTTVKLNVFELLEKSIALNEHYCKECHVGLKLQHTNNRDLMINGDEKRLLQVMSNLISNSSKFTYNDDIIEITLNSDDNSAIIEITDHGPGIPEDQQKLLFTKFKQLDTQINNKLPGTGLGLNISKNIIELHNGTIDFHSTPNVVTTFTLNLPLVN